MGTSIGAAVAALIIAEIGKRFKKGMENMGSTYETPEMKTDGYTDFNNFESNVEKSEIGGIGQSVKSNSEPEESDVEFPTKEEPSAEENITETTDMENKNCLSDENLKTIYGDNIDDMLIENFAKISAIDFNYTPMAQEEYKGGYGVNSDEHVGVIAQELEANEATKGTVSENENGDKVVDTGHLALADTAAIAELSRRVLALEEIVKELQNR